MKFFNFGKKDEFVDLSDYKKQQNWPLSDEDDSKPKESVDKHEELNLEKPVSPEDRKKKFIKRIAELTDTVEELTNQVYHLQQRTELLEKKLNIHR